MIAVHQVRLGSKADCPVLAEFQMIRPAATPLGIYAEGTPVRVLRIDGEAVRLCLDPAGYHPTGHCHTATVPRRWVGLLDWQPTGIAA